MTNIVHVTKRFEYSGSTTVWMVPAGVHNVTIRASGAGGGGGGSNPTMSTNGWDSNGMHTPGISGDLTVRTIPVSAGDRFFMDIGEGGRQGGYAGRSGTSYGGLGGRSTLPGIHSAITTGYGGNGISISGNNGLYQIAGGGAGGGGATEIKINRYRDVVITDPKYPPRFFRLLSANGGAGGPGSWSTTAQFGTPSPGGAGGAGGIGWGYETWFEPNEYEFDTSPQTTPIGGSLGGQVAYGIYSSQPGTNGWVEIEYDQNIDETLIILENIDNEYTWMVGETNLILYGTTRAQIGGRLAFVPRLRISDSRPVNYYVELTVRSLNSTNTQIPGELTTSYPDVINSNLFETGSWSYNKLNGQMTIVGNKSHVNGIFETIAFVQNIDWLALDDGGFVIHLNVMDELGRQHEGDWYVYSVYGTYDRYNNITWMLSRDQPNTIHEWSRYEDPAHNHGHQFVNVNQKLLYHRIDDSPDNNNAQHKNNFSQDVTVKRYSSRKTLLTTLYSRPSKANSSVYTTNLNPHGNHLNFLRSVTANSLSYKRIPLYIINRIFTTTLLKESTRSPLNMIRGKSSSADHVKGGIPLYSITNATMWTALMPPIGSSWFTVNKIVCRVNSNLSSITRKGYQFSQSKMTIPFNYGNVRHTSILFSDVSHYLKNISHGSIIPLHGFAVQKAFMHYGTMSPLSYFGKFSQSCWRGQQLYSQFEYYISFSRFDGGQFFRNYNDDPMDNWHYNATNDSVTSQFDSTRPIGLVSKDSFDHFQLVSRVGSTSNDDDYLGLIVAFQRDENGVNHALVALRAGHATHSFKWGLSLYSSDTAGLTHLWNGSSTIQETTNGNWSDTSHVWIKITRNGDLVTLVTSQYGSDTFDPTTEFTVDLSTISNTNLQKLRKSSNYGFFAFGQANTFYKDIWLNPYDSLNNRTERVQPQTVPFHNFFLERAMLGITSTNNRRLVTAWRLDSKHKAPFYLRTNVPVHEVPHISIRIPTTNRLVSIKPTNIRFDLNHVMTKNPSVRTTLSVGITKTIVPYHLLPYSISYIKYAGQSNHRYNGISGVFAQPVFGIWDVYNASTHRPGRSFQPDVEESLAQGSATTPDGGRPPYGRISGGISYLIHPGYLRGYGDPNNPADVRNSPYLETGAFTINASWRKISGRLNG